MSRRPPPRLLSVIRKKQISPNLLRLTFAGPQLDNFPENHQGANVKLLLPHSGQSWRHYLDALNGIGPKPIKRTYTIRDHRAADNELDIDFALHPNPGPATSWALNAGINQQLGISGPGSISRINTRADWFLMAADMSALPALSVNLAALSSDADGVVFITIAGEQDKQLLKKPIGVNLKWIVEPSPESAVSALVDAVTSQSWPAALVSTWVAGETSMVRQIREHFVAEKGLEREFRYTSGFWKIGHTEDTHHLIKRSEPQD